MNNLSKSPLKSSLAPLLLIGLPTFLLSLVVLMQANKQLGILEQDWLHQGIYLGLGIFAGILCYGWQFRFFLLTVVIYILGNVVFSIMNQMPLGESFAFEWSLRFYLYGGLLFTGFILGFSLLRWRIATILWIISLWGILVLYLTKSKQPSISEGKIALLFLLTFGYSIYLLFTTELIRKKQEDCTLRLGYYFRKTGIALVILLLLTVLVGIVFNKDFGTLAEKLSEGHFDQKNNATSMTKRNKDGSLQNNEQMRLTGGLSKGKSLVFVAHLNHFMEDGRTPNPLYFTAFYYTKFDSLSQSFLTDDKMPSSDLFRPDPSTIPLYFNKIDSNVIRNAKATIDREVISTEVYKVGLSPQEFVAPSTAFLCQPISIPKEYQGQFKSAYRAQMWVSKLNSAYFVYNPGEEMGMQMFQQQRFETLRKAAGYDSEDSAFMRYYTRFPNGPQYAKINQLAHLIGDQEQSVMDKMLAIRSFFLQKDDNGKPLFQYSDNPGIPGIPTASKLDYFLFQNRKGYCAYYAGATLLLLRAMGVPSRIAAGFMAIDRSSKNPGWYWFYADQAHAWVQVYFPGYGWMDFDTTIPDVNTQQAPQPDGTPPLGNMQTYFVADGDITAIDRQKKEISIQLKRFILQQKNFPAQSSISIKIDASLAKISADSGNINFSDLQKGMHVTAASSAEALKNLKANNDAEANQVLSTIAQPIPVDEVRITLNEQKKETSTETENTIETVHHWQRTLAICLAIALFILVIFYTIPHWVWAFFKKKSQKSLFYSYQGSLFYLYQLGNEQDQESPDNYAKKIDQKFGSDFGQFCTIYQKYKYSKTPLSQEEQTFTQTFLPKFVRQIKTRIPAKERGKHFLNPFRTFQFFRTGKWKKI